MHYVLLWWFKEKIQPLLKGFSGAVVYADDFVMSFQYKSDAELVYELLKKKDEALWTEPGREEDKVDRIWKICGSKQSQARRTQT